MTPEEIVAAQVAPDRPERPDESPDRLFKDVQEADPEFADALLELWQRGELIARYDEESGETLWKLSEFGEALRDAGLDEHYARAWNSNIDLEEPAPALEVTGGP